MSWENKIESHKYKHLKCSCLHSEKFDDALCVSTTKKYRNVHNIHRLMIFKIFFIDNKALRHEWIKFSRMLQFCIKYIKIFSIGVCYSVDLPANKNRLLFLLYFFLFCDSLTSKQLRDWTREWPSVNILFLAEILNSFWNGLWEFLLFVALVLNINFQRFKDFEYFL